MGKISLDLSSIKAAGVYTIEIDNSTRSNTTTNAIRLMPGFSNKGPFNRPVYLQDDSDRLAVFGDVDTKLEHKGCFFNRMLRTLLTNGPVLALNLLKVDDTYSGPDQVNYAALSLNAADANPKITTKNNKYGEYDYLSTTVDFNLYGTEQDDVIPFVGTTPYSSLYNRSRFWTPDKELLTAAAARGLDSQDYTQGSGSYEHTNLLNFANVGTEEFSILVFKPENISGYDRTASAWYGGAANIPFGWIRPGDYISDYFIQVVCVKGNWSNYSVLSTDPVWGSYFDEKGVIKSKINNFISAEGVTLLGSWTGIIIPDFVDQQGNNLSIERKINAATETTGLLMSFNEDAAHVLNYDYSGADGTESDPHSGEWGFDIDNDGELTAEDGESSPNNYIVDMVGHEIFRNLLTSNDNKGKVALNYEYISTSKNNVNVDGIYTEAGVKKKGQFTAHPIILANVFDNDKNLILVKESENPVALKKENVWYVTDTNSKTDTQYVFKASELSNVTDNVDKKHILRDMSTIGIAKPEASASMAKGMVEEVVTGNNEHNYYITKEFNNTTFPISTDLENVFYTTGIYFPMDFIKTSNPDDTEITDRNVKTFKKATTNNLRNLINPEYYILSETGSLTKKIIPDNSITVVHYNYGSQDDKTLASNPTGATNNVQLSFIVNGETYFANLLVTVRSYKNNDYIVTVKADTSYQHYSAHQFIDYNLFTERDAERAGVESSENLYGVPLDIAKNPTGQPTASVGMVIKPSGKIQENNATKIITGVNFLSYNYLYDEDSKDNIVPGKAAFTKLSNVYYFNDKSLWKNEIPVSSEIKNQFIITDKEYWSDDYIKLGDFIQNITYYNKTGETQTYKIIPGVTRVVKKQFIPVVNGMINWKGKMYDYEGETSTAHNGAVGFYLVTTTEHVFIDTKERTVVRQLPLTSDVISHSLRFIPMKGLKLQARHKPGYDENGSINIEAGIKKIYSVLEEPGIQRGLCNSAMVDYRYIIDSMSYGLDSELGGKVYLSRLAKNRGKCTALLNLPSAKQFAVSANPYFCDSYIVGTQSRPSFDTKYIPQGGNTEMGASKVFSLPTEDNGSKFTAAFFPHLVYNENGKKIIVPPAADVANVFYRKFTGIADAYAICANQSGIITNKFVKDIEFDSDVPDREYLEPFGVNTIIKDNRQIMIYGNQTCYQDIKSDFNKLHVRENLNTAELECNAVLKTFNFLYNTPATRAAIVQTLTPILSTMQTSGAISTFEIICNESNNTQEVIESDYGVVDVKLSFNHGMERILLRLTVNRYQSNTENS